MFEDALFGHVRGAFTGATNDADGYLLESNGGTAFFDEVSGLTPQMQVKLLRAIETGVFRPVGARMDRNSDFRVVAALNEPLDDLLETGRFRHDLAHRLATFVIHVPPLVDRPADIAHLARVFAQRAGAAHLPPVELSASAIRALEQYEWPGNVRELRNVIHATVALADSPTITGPMLVETLASRGAKIEGAGKLSFQRRQLIELLNECDWNTVEVANRLGVDRATVYRRMTSAGIPTLTRTPGRRRSESEDQGSTMAM
jgi:DNA-binding NtrC family response regulator